MKCPNCAAEMKVLFTSFFCPKDCDKPQATPVPSGNTFVYTHTDGTRWSVQWVEEHEWPTTTDHRGWHVTKDRAIPDKTALLLAERDRALQSAYYGTCWRSDGPGAGVTLWNGAYQGKQSHPGFVFRKLP